MTQRTLRNEVETKLRTWAESKSPVIQVAYENVSFTKPTTTFVEVYISPAATVNPTVNAKRATQYGIIQINIYCKAGEGTKKSEDLAQELIELFPVIPKSGTVSIEQTGSIMAPLYDAQWRVLPVRFQYRQENYL